MKKKSGIFSFVAALCLGGCVFEQDAPPSNSGHKNDTVAIAPVLQPVAYGDDTLTIRWNDENNHVYGPTGSLLKPVAYRAEILTTGDTCTVFREWMNAVECDVHLPSPSQEKQFVYEVVGLYEGNKYGRAKRDSITLSPPPTWTSRASGTTRNLNAVVRNGSLLVAVGDSGVVWTSPNGTEWTQQATGTKQGLRAVAWSANRFIAVGDSGTILASGNGSTWLPEASGTTSTLRSVSGGAGKFVAVGDAGIVLTSNGNGSWSSQQVTTRALHVVLWTGENFATGGEKAFFSSVDGTEWSPSSSIAYWVPAVTLFGFALGASRLVAVGSQVRCDLPQSCAGELYPYPFGFATSSTRPDSLAASSGPLERVKADLRAIAWNGNEFLAVGGGYQAVSRNGVWWSTKNGIPDLHAVVWTGTHWVGVGATGVHTSP